MLSGGAGRIFERGDHHEGDVIGLRSRCYGFVLRFAGPVPGTLSGARVLTRDDPAFALGMLVISHDRHPFAAAGRFTVIKHGKTFDTASRGKINAESLQDIKAGGRERAELEDSMGGTV